MDTFRPEQMLIIMMIVCRIALIIRLIDDDSEKKIRIYNSLVVLWRDKPCQTHTNKIVQEEEDVLFSWL